MDSYTPPVNGVTRLPRHKMSQGLALLALMVMGGFAIAGPSGLFSWSENLQLLEQRKAQIAVLEAERRELRNRVELLDPENTDPDLVGELLRSNLNVVHPDEIVITFEDQTAAR